jgi:hypothetical protein
MAAFFSDTSDFALILMALLIELRLLFLHAPSTLW